MARLRWLRGERAGLAGESFAGESFTGILPVEHDEFVGHVPVQLSDVFAGVHGEDGDLHTVTTFVIGGAEESADQGEHGRQLSAVVGVQTNAHHGGVCVRMVFFQLMRKVDTDEIIGG